MMELSINKITGNKLIVISVLIFFLFSCGEERKELNKFESIEEGEVLDKSTGLVWMACSYGQEWKNDSCHGDTVARNWSDAKSVAKNSSFGGKNYWRLPTRDELRALFDNTNILLHQREKRAIIDERFFPNTPVQHYLTDSVNCETESVGTSNFTHDMFVLDAATLREPLSFRLVREVDAATAKKTRLEKRKKILLAGIKGVTSGGPRFYHQNRKDVYVITDVKINKAGGKARLFKYGKVKIDGRWIQSNDVGLLTGEGNGDSYLFSGKIMDEDVEIEMSISNEACGIVQGTWGRSSTKFKECGYGSSCSWVNFERYL